MSFAYDAYIDMHKKYVRYSLKWIQKNIATYNLIQCFPDLTLETSVDPNIFADHDQSKFMPEEYDAYDNYFYNGGYSTEEGKKRFDEAFLHHIHMNPHHWQHWVLVDDWGDDWASSHVTEKQVRAQDMPDIYILEMICDWWSFSWRKYFENGGNEESEKYIYDIFKWYDDHKNTIVFSESTKKKVEKFLDMIYNKIPFGIFPEQDRR